MKFSVSLGDFQKAIFRVLPAIPPKSTLPVLEHIHCTLINNSLSMIASDQEMTISTSSSSSLIAVLAKSSKPSNSFSYILFHIDIDKSAT